MRKSYVRLLLLLIVLLMVISWSKGTRMEIAAFIEDQERYIREKDMVRYLENISKENDEYMAEKISWLRDILYYDIEDYQVEVNKVKRVGLNKVQAQILQSYNYQGRQYETQLPLLLVKERGKWKDGDLNFKELSTEHFTIKYFKPSKKYAELIKSVCEDAKTNIESRYGKGIDEHTTVKIYQDLETLRQSVKLSFQWQFAGWYEYPESIKTSEYGSRESYQRILEHELVHKLTIKESNNNMPYWFTEGLAVYYSNHYNDPYPIKTKELYIREYHNEPLDILKLEKTNLEMLEDSKTISAYYDSAGMIVKFLVDAFGEEKIKEIVSSLGDFPYQEGTGAEVDREAQKRFHSILPKVLGMDVIQLNEAWNQYISK